MTIANQASAAAYRQSKAHLLLVQQIKDEGLLPEPVPEWQFCPPRKWRFDLSWPRLHLAVEIEGGSWTEGRHTRGAGFERDCLKYNSAILMGWQVLRFTSGMVEDGRAIAVLRELWNR